MQCAFFDQKEKGNKGTGAEILSGIFLGISAFYAVLTSFSLSWSARHALRGGFLSGFCSVWNSIADTFGEKEYILLRRLAAGMLGGKPAAQDLFLTVFLLVLVLIAVFAVRSRHAWIPAFFVLPFLVLIALFSISPSRFSALLLLAAAAAACGGTHPDDSPGRFRLPVWTLFLALMVTAAAGTFFFTFLPEKAGPAGTALTDAVGRLNGDNPLPGGNAGAFTGEKLKKERGTIGTVRNALTGKTGGGEKPALVLKTEKSGAYYLKGFVGDRYAAGRWTALDPSVYYEAGDMQYWLNRKGFDGLSQMADVNALLRGSPDSEAAEITVRSADRAYVYIPYEISGTEKEVPRGSKNCAGARLLTGSPFGAETYTFRTAQPLTGKWTNQVGKLFSRESTEQSDQYFVCESHYNRFVYEHYLAYPEMLGAAFAEAVGASDSRAKNHRDYKKAIEQVRKYLNENFSYSDDFPAAGEEFVTSFLSSGKGCDVHFATLASLLFRYCGIPARYVEGYLVTAFDADAASGGEITIGRSHCHAWTEIYIDGYGWVPLEVTPGYENVMPEADLRIGLEAARTEGGTLPQSTVQEKRETEPESETRAGKLLRGLFWLLALALLAYLVFRLLRHVLRNIRAELFWRRAFRDPDPKRAAAAMYEYMREKEIPISVRGKELGIYAAYSSGGMTEDGRTEMAAELKKGKRVKTDAKIKRKRIRNTAWKQIRNTVRRESGTRLGADHEDGLERE